MIAGNPRPGRVRPRRTRRGAAAVEFAVCLPVLVLLVFGSIEACSYIFLKQALHVAAYEGVRESTRLSSNNAAGRSRAETILNSRGVSGYSIDFPRGEAADADRGENVVITVSAPTGVNSPLLGSFIADRTIEARITMTRE